MKKLITVSIIILVLSIILSCALSVFATEDTLAESEINLFDKKGDYIKFDPFENPFGSWLLMGPRAVKNEGSDTPYPIIIDNKEGSSDSFYYVAGSNNMTDLSLKPDLIDYLENDFVVEYEVKYGLSDVNGHISLAIAYNYHKNFYIDAYVANDGTGDIAIVTDKGATSVMAEDSILDPQSSIELMEAIYGKGKATRFADPFVVSLRVTVNENKMPVKIYMYLNGCLIAQTNEEFESLVDAITPEYTIAEGATFPKDKLGNLIAIKASVGSVGEINRVKAYTVDNENYTPSGFGAKHYAEKFGNESFDPSVYPELEEDSTEETTEEITESHTERNTEANTGDASEESSENITDETIESTNGSDSQDTQEEETTKKNRHDDDEEDEYLIDVISTMCLILGCASAAIIVIAVVILKLRTREK